VKCVKKNTVIVRVSNEKAEKLVKEEGYKYVPKHLWKDKRKQ